MKRRMKIITIHNIQSLLKLYLAGKMEKENLKIVVIIKYKCNCLYGNMIQPHGLVSPVVGL